MAGAKKSLYEERSGEFDCGVLQGIENSECSISGDFSFASFHIMAEKKEEINFIFTFGLIKE